MNVMTIQTIVKLVVSASTRLEATGVSVNKVMMSATAEVTALVRYFFLSSYGCVYLYQ